MPRRPLLSATPTRASSESKRISVFDPPSDDTYLNNLRVLRTNWKWAAFSQFFYTFARLLSMPDVSLLSIEDDLAGSTSLYIPRVIHRLLYTLTQDRKINIDNWQSSLRKQYLKRSQDNNPLGPEPIIPQDTEQDEQQPLHSTPQPEPADPDNLSSRSPSQLPDPSNSLQLNPQIDPSDSVSVHLKKESSPDPGHPTQQSRDWFDLSLLEKLDSLYILTEWQFQNPHRLRSLMKDDDDGASWRIEPIGYDAKTNAYWLIGPDRLWIQRVPPKPPRAPKRKRQPAARKSNGIKPSTSKHIDDDTEDEIPQPRSAKRKRIQPKAGSRTRSSASIQEPSPITNGSRSRAAKVQANKKLDAQAKELAEFQRQTAAAQVAAVKKQSVATRSQGNQSSSPRKTVLGTRASARLRGSGNAEDDEWQPIPAEWLEEPVHDSKEMNVGRATRSSSRKKGKGKEKQVVSEHEEDDEGEDEGAQEEESGQQTATLSDDGDSSELTELSDIESEPGSVTVDTPDPPQVGNKPRNRPSRLTNGKTATKPLHEKPHNAVSNGEEPVVESALALPDGFIEWEAICITLYEWEHIGERFEKAAHYLEKALYKVLSKTIVPEVTADLKEVERKRKLEEAIVHRKRSSRIAIKESEKEEARMLAKKNAEEDEKLARTRRIEARTKKEEAERAKREQAREQRRLEREERERRAQAKEERRERARAAGEREVSSSAPTASAAPSPGPSHLAQSTPPSGAKTPDWILDCEICGKRGTNVDDGLPMVSCGVCSRWQHITCYDHVDRMAGRPRRNWEYQQFFCQRCRTQGTGTSLPPPRQYPTDDRQHTSFYSQKPHVPYLQPGYYPPSTSHMRESQSFTAEGDPYRSYQYTRPTSIPETGFSRSQYPYSQSVYSQAQPDQRGFTSQSTQFHTPALGSMTHRMQASGNQPARPSQYGTYTNGLGDARGVTRQSPPYTPLAFGQPSSVRDAYMVSDARHSTSRDNGQANGTSTENQSTYGGQSSTYLPNGSWRYPGQQDHSSERPVQFYRP